MDCHRWDGGFWLKRCKVWVVEKELRIFHQGLQRPHVECPKLNFTVIMKSGGQGYLTRAQHALDKRVSSDSTAARGIAGHQLERRKAFSLLGGFARDFWVSFF